MFVFHKIPYPYIHDLAALVTILIKTGILIPETVQESAKLTRFAIATRYPQILPSTTEQEYRRAMIIAEAVVRWSEREITSGKR